MEFEFINIIAVISGIISCVIVFMLVRNVVSDKGRLKEMGNDAYNHNNYNNVYCELQDKIFTLDKRIDTLEKDKKVFEEEIKKLTCDINDNIITIYSHLIALTKIIQNDKRHSFMQSLQRDRARLSTQSKYLSKEKRLQGIAILGMLGNLDDIADLVKIINDPTEDKEIIEIAKMRKEEIEKRLGL